MSNIRSRDIRTRVPERGDEACRDVVDERNAETFGASVIARQNPIGCGGRPILRQIYRNFGLSCRTEKRRFDHSGGHTMPHRLDSDLELDRRPFFEMRCA